MPQPQSTQERENSAIEDILEGRSEDDKVLLKHAFTFAKESLGEKLRNSGQTFLEHNLETARTLAEWKMSTPTVLGGLLHSSVDSGANKSADIKREFGPEILRLAQGTRALTSLRYKGKEQYLEDLRRFFIALAGDIRIILITFAHRLDSMRKIAYKPTAEQTRVALETIEVYAPLANRLGMGKLKAEFETLAFPYAYPKEYALTRKLLDSREKHARERLQKIYRSLRADFAASPPAGGLPIVESDYRLKNIYSLYKKLLRHDMDITKIHDLIALRLVTDTVENCYRALGIIHGKYKPVAGKVKDYIANPKPNGYRSIHTTIYTGDPAKGADLPRRGPGKAGGGTAEVQIRTKEMHAEAEYGVAAHVAYDEGNKSRSGGRWAASLAWVRELVELACKAKNVNEFAEAVKLDYFKNQIFVFTPDGDVVELPEESTPIDFAYRVHSGLGDHAHAAKVNGKYAALSTKLHGGETVFIETKKDAHPTAKWLDFAKSTQARKKIRAYLSKR